jgi:hypothetical protein
MKDFNKRIAGIAGCVLMAFAAEAQDNTVVLTQDQYSYAVAGEFSMDTSGNFVGNYAPVATMGGNFETFCVESDVIFYPGQTYSYVLSDEDSKGRALSEGAAYLYYEFATGQLAGYDYSSPAARFGSLNTSEPMPTQRLKASVFGGSRLADAGELQVAIWEFQNGQSFPGYPSYTTDPFYSLVTNALGAAAFSPNNGTYNVDIIQLWDGAIPAQNQLVYLGATAPVSMPDGASTSGLLALACAGLVLLARRLNQQELATVRATKNPTVASR